jgi:hypothetical protein
VIEGLHKDTKIKERGERKSVRSQHMTNSFQYLVGKRGTYFSIKQKGDAHKIIREQGTDELNLTQTVVTHHVMRNHNQKACKERKF